MILFYKKKKKSPSLFILNNRGADVFLISKFPGVIVSAYLCYRPNSRRKLSKEIFKKKLKKFEWKITWYREFIPRSCATTLHARKCNDLTTTENSFFFFGSPIWGFSAADAIVDPIIKYSLKNKKRPISFVKKDNSKGSGR